MSKAKKKMDDSIKSKAVAHKNFKSKINQDLSGASRINRTAGKILMAKMDGPPPFKFIITILINPAITIKSVNIDGVIAQQEDFKVKDGNVICEIEAFVSTFTFLLMIDAEGDADTTTTFNITCDDKKVFAGDQQITITSSGRGGYMNKKIPLP